MSCPNNAACPGCHKCDGPYRGWIVVGKRATHAHAQRHGGAVGEGEAAVHVPDEVIERDITRPLTARIAELEQQLAAANARCEAIAAERDTGLHENEQLRAAVARVMDMPMHLRDGHWWASSREILRAIGPVAPEPTGEQIAGLLQGMAERARSGAGATDPVDKAATDLEALAESFEKALTDHWISPREQCRSWAQAIRAVLADRKDRDEQIDSLYERIHGLEVDYCALWDSALPAATSGVAAVDVAQQAAEKLAAYIEARAAGQDASISWGEMRIVVADRNRLAARVPQLEAAVRQFRGWELEDEQYQVLLGETVYDQCTARGALDAIVSDLRAEIENGLLEDGPISARWCPQFATGVYEFAADGRPERGYGDGVAAPILPIDPDKLEAAATRFEAWLAFAAVNQPGKDHLADVSYSGAGYPIGDDDLKILLTDYRYHRPTQWAYDQACRALHQHEARANAAEAQLADFKTARPCGRSATHPPHKWISARRTVQCLGVGEYDDAAANSADLCPEGGAQ